MTNLAQVPMYTSLSDLVDISLTALDTNELDCSLTINHDGIDYQAYTAAVSYCELTLYTNAGTFTYVVDVYGSNHYAVLHDWSLDSDGE
jgi:hypothetical protein